MKDSWHIDDLDSKSKLTLIKFRFFWKFQDLHGSNFNTYTFVPKILLDSGFFDIILKILFTCHDLLPWTLTILGLPGNLYQMPQVFNIPKVEHDQPCSTMVVLFFQISLFIYVILGPDWPRAKIKVNKQTNLEKQNNQSWA